MNYPCISLRQSRLFECASVFCLEQFYTAKKAPELRPIEEWVSCELWSSVLFSKSHTSKSFRSWKSRLTVFLGLTPTDRHVS